MPLFYQQNINASTSLAIWHIEEPETFFLQKVPLQRSITHPNKRLQHLAGRYLLQHLFPDFPYDEIIIADTRKPYLPNEQYHFSISHCGNYAAAIASKNLRVGVDVELPTERLYNISEKFLSREELQHFNILDTLRTPQQIQLLTTLWSAKEAIFKWWSYGSVDFSENINLEHFSFADEGTFEGRFIKADAHFNLQLHYKLFDEVSLVWVAC